MPEASILSMNFGRKPGRAQATNNFTVLIAGLLEEEDIGHGDDIAFHPADFGNIDHFSSAISQTFLVDDQIDRRGNLLSDCPHWQLHPSHHRHRFKT